MEIIEDYQNRYGPWIAIRASELTNGRSVWIAPPQMDSRRTVGRTVVGTRSDGRRPFYSSIKALYTPFKARSGRSGFGNPAVGFRSESKSEMKCQPKFSGGAIHRDPPLTAILSLAKIDVFCKRSEPSYWRI